MRALHFGMARKLLAHRDFIDTALLPFLAQQHPVTLAWVLHSCPNIQHYFQTAAVTAAAASTVFGHDAAQAAPSLNNADAGGLYSELLWLKKLQQQRASESLGGNGAAGDADAHHAAPSDAEFERHVSATAAASARVAMPFRSVREALRVAARRDGDAARAVGAGLEALRFVELVQRRLAATAHRSLTHVPFEFAVGDMVVHTQLRQVSVVAARLPVCFESDEWLAANLGSAADARVAQPWYLMLVARHEGVPADFTRYGSQLSHVRLCGPAAPGESAVADDGAATEVAAAVGAEDRRNSRSTSGGLRFCGSIGLHRYLPLYFSGFDAARAMYVPRAQQHYQQQRAAAAAAATPTAATVDRQQQQQHRAPTHGRKATVPLVAEEEVIVVSHDGASSVVPRSKLPSNPTPVAAATTV